MSIFRASLIICLSIFFAGCDQAVTLPDDEQPEQITEPETIITPTTRTITFEATGAMSSPFEAVMYIENQTFTINRTLSAGQTVAIETTVPLDAVLCYFTWGYQNHAFYYRSVRVLVDGHVVKSWETITGNCGTFSECHL